MDRPRRAHVRARRRRRSRRAFASVSRRRARRSRRDGVVPRALDGVEHGRQRRGGAFQGDGDALAEEETPRRDGGEGGARGCARGGGGGGGGADAEASTPPSSREPTLSEVIANLAAEPCIEPVSGDLAAALARLGIDVPRPAADERERDSPPPRKRPTRPRRDAHVFPKRVGGGYRRGDGTPFARPPGRGDRPSATTVAPPPRAPRAPHRLAKAADADPPLEVASQEVIRLGEIRTRAHYGPWAHLWWGEVASADDRASSSASASSSGSAASAAPFAVGFSVRTKLRRPESNSHARRTGTGPYGGRVVTRGVPVPEPRVAAVVECVVEERVVGKPWEGPIFRAAWRGGSRTGTRWTMGGPRRAPRVVEGVGTTPEAAVDALRAAVRRASRGAVAAAAKLPPADVLFGFAPGRAARALAQLTMITGTPTRIPPGEGCGLALVRHASKSNLYDGDFAASSSSTWSSSLGEFPLAPGYQTSFRLCAGVHARCRVVSREEAKIGGASTVSSGVAFVVERWDLGAVAARAVAADPDRAWAKMPEERRLAAGRTKAPGNARSGTRAGSGRSSSDWRARACCERSRDTEPRPRRGTRSSSRRSF